MSILNVNQIQPLGGGSTITVSANDVNFSGNISIGSSFVGTATTASLATSAQGLTGTPDITVGNIQSGIVTATTFIGDGSGLTGVTASGSGINIKDSGSTVGVAATIDFSTNLNVSPASAGIVTVTVGDTDFAIADKIVHTGDTNTAIRFPAADTITAETAGSERLRITSAGSVGIGTTNPGAKTHIDSVTSNTPLVVEASQNNRSRIVFRNNVETGTECNIELFDDDLRFVTNSGERLRITSDGAISVGNASQMGSSYARISIDCQGRDVLTDVTDVTKYGLAFHNDPNTNDANGIGFFNDDGTNCGGYILHQDKGSNNLGDLIFGTSATSNNPIERLRIDSSGRVGINTNTFNDAAEALRVQAPSGQNNTHLTIKAGSTSGYSVLNFGDNDFNEGRIKYDHSSNTMEFFADDTGFMKYIDDSTGGRFSVTSTGTYLTATTVDYYCNFNSSRTYGQYISKNGTGTYGLFSYTQGGNSTQYSIFGQVDTNSTHSSGGGLFYSINNNTYGIVGYWSGGNSGAYYTIYGNGVSLCTGGHTTSDARLKDVQSGIGTGILDKVCSLEAKKYTWKENTQQRRSVGAGTQIGLLAQDVLEHFPEVVMEHKNPEIAGHNPETLNEQIGTTYSIDYGKMTAVLIEAIKDLKAENNALTARVTALEGS
jgi:hypothetical protein